MSGYDGIDEALDITSETVESTPVKKEKPDRLTKTDIDKDYQYSRGQLYSIIEKGQETLDGVMELAQETNSPRAYEVAGQLIKNVSDATDKLIDLQKKLKDLNAEDKKGPSHVTNNALIVGTTAELQKLIKQGLMDEKK
jgi:hypothetical protein|tara:strand:- start:2843 stop:3259 length:417 start_codon:yes stop_codon:yes gene_type:complete